MNYAKLCINGVTQWNTINLAEGSYTITGCSPATKYVIYFTDPSDSLVTVSNTLGITTSRIKYTKGTDLWGEYDTEDGGIILYFKVFDNKYEYQDISIYRNNELYFDLSTFYDLYTDKVSLACLQEHGFYMVFSLTGTQSMNYTPKDSLFGFIDMSAEAGLTYTYYFRDKQGYRISDDITITCKQLLFSAAQITDIIIL